MMKNKRIKLTLVGHYVFGNMLALLAYIVLFFILDSFQPITEQQDGETLYAVWFVFWSAFIVLSALVSFVVVLDLEDSIMLTKFVNKTWLTIALFISFNFISILVLTVSWKTIKLFEIVEIE